MRMEAYARNHENPICRKVGLKEASYPSRGENIFKTEGRAKAIAVVAAACMPIVFVNISTVKPLIKPRINTSAFGNFTGNNKINNT